MKNSIKDWFAKKASDTPENWSKFLKLRDQAIDSEYSKIAPSETLLLPKGLDVELHCYCPGCGKPLKGASPALWFGDWFCGVCVEKMKHGERPK
jgi:hypothetical protein